MKGSVRVPIHSPEHTRLPAGDFREGEDRFIGRSCYVFNTLLHRQLDDTRCSHCRHYLTARCPHIEEFLDDMDDMTPE